MSTFKRLFNVGKGKAKTVRKDVASALDPVDLLESARHKAADAAEAVADAIRPGDAPEEPTPAAPRATRRAPAAETAVDSVVEDAEEVAQDIEEARKQGPPKKRL